ncbi:hypothetical protein TSAR_013999 [Trichomalopsis sarcophagae]|uniref:Uncharacterized protein n=1 Tax=Trichomalopsis sarcophagae TaxID=543379 RepID=A0A232FCQ8_9HYME|nr:hypothetical protein TSAR_013999 [Trichomalopsis sarcophagae]
MPLNNCYFSTNLKGLEKSVTRYFFDVETWFCMVMNMYNKKKKLRTRAITFVFFGFSSQKMAFFP